MARLMEVVDNSEVKDVLSGFASFYEIPAWMDDVIRGAKGQHGGTQQVSSSKVFRLLQSLSELSTESVGERLNHTAVEIDGKEYGERMIRYYTAITRCASQGIKHQLLIGREWEQKNRPEVFNFKQDAQNYEYSRLTNANPRVYFDGMTRDFTDEEREMVRILSIKGSSEQLKQYIAGLSD